MFSNLSSVRGGAGKEIVIESPGGSDPMTSHGHTKGDARRIKEMIEDAQSSPENYDSAVGKAD